MTQPRLAAVTGAAAGIGLAVARRLGAAGLRVALLDRDAAALAALPPEPWMAERSALDVSDPASIEASFTALAGRHGPVGVLVNNAGVAAAHPFLEHPLEAWSDVMSTNVTGVKTPCRNDNRQFCCAVQGCCASPLPIPAALRRDRAHWTRAVVFSYTLGANQTLGTEG